MTEGLTNEEYYQGVLKRIPGTGNPRCKGRFSSEYKDLINLYYLTESNKSVCDTAKYFKESAASVRDILGIKPKTRYKSKPKTKTNQAYKFNMPMIKPNNGLSSLVSNHASSEEEIVVAITKILFEFKNSLKEQVRKEVRAEILESLK